MNRKCTCLEGKSFYLKIFQLNSSCRHRWVSRGQAVAVLADRAARGFPRWAPHFLSAGTSGGVSWDSRRAVPEKTTSV